MFSASTGSYVALVPMATAIYGAAKKMEAAKSSDGATVAVGQAKLSGLQFGGCVRWRNPKRIPPTTVASARYRRRRQHRQDRVRRDQYYHEFRVELSNPLVGIHG